MMVTKSVWTGKPGKQTLTDKPGSRKEVPGLDREVMYRAVIETSSDGFWLTDAQGRILEVNDAYVRRSGYSREELLAMSVTDLEAGESPAETAVHIEKIIREGSEIFESLHRAKDGTVWQVELNVSYWQINGGLFFTFLRDISRRKRIDDLLRTRVVLSELADRGTIDDLLQHALDAAELQSGSNIGFFHLVDEDQKTLTFQTWSTNTLRSMCPAEAKGGHYPIIEAGVWADCVQSRAPVIHNDYASLPHKKGMPEGHAAVVRELIVPVLRGDKIVSIMGVGNKTGDYDQEDVQCVQEIASLVMDLVFRKRVETELRESQARLTRAQRVARLGNWDWDFRTDSMYWSEENYRIFGIAPNVRPAYDAFIQTVDPGDREFVNQSIADALSGRKRFDVDYTIIRPDSGERRIINATGDVIRDDKGRPVKMVGTVQDITQRNKSEEALRASEKMLQTIIDTEPECVKLLDENANLISMNRAGLDMIQADSLDQVRGKCVCPLITSEYVEPFRELTRQVFQGGTGTLLFEVIGMKGRRRWLETRAVPLRNEKDEIFALLGVTRDVTERKQAEEQILQSEKFIRSILDTVDEGFIVIDRDYRILTANKAYCSQVGGSDEKILGSHCYEISHKLDRPCFEEGEDCAVRGAFASGIAHSSLHRHADANGNVLYVETKAFPIKDDSGTVNSVIETINNITEKYLLEEERLKTQKLESIGMLAGGIAHDFNNLLQGVFGYISMAKISLDQREKARSMLEQAEEALHMSVNLTTQLLTFSKGGTPVKKLIRLGPAVENAVKFALSGSHTDYRLDLAPDLWQVEADSGQLAQVIQNIVLNAHEAMAGRGTVTISVKNVDIPSKTSLGLPEGGRFVRIDVEDSGSGIPGQNLTKIFDPYFTTKKKGSGLGLATSYSIIRNHGGIIEVKSELNRGTTFTIHLPAATAVEQDIATIPAATGGAKKGRILLMDDEDLVREVAAEMITALGHEVESAEDGEKAIALYRQAMESGYPYDLLILDLTIKGGMGGEEAIQKILEIDPHARAVVSSGYADNPIVAHYRDSGFIAFLNKPYKLAALKDCLDKSLLYKH